MESSIELKINKSPTTCVNKKKEDRILNREPVIQTQREKIMIVIPAYNEIGSIESVIKNAMPFSSNILVISDGSTDGTEEAAKTTGARVISFETNKGKGAAMRKGIKEFLSTDSETLVFLDADGQYNTSDIPMLVNTLIEGNYDIVVGSRFLGEYLKNANENYRTRIACNKLSTRITQLLSGVKTTDAQSGLLALNRNACEKLDLEGNAWGIHQEIIVRTGKKGLRYGEVPIIFNIRLNGRSKIKVIRYPFMALPTIINAWVRE